MAKLFYSWQIGRDKHIPETVIRSSTIPEELGRISFLLSDKTGTLTKNEMHFKKIHLGTVAFSSDAFEEVGQHVRSAYAGRLAKYVHFKEFFEKMNKNSFFLYFWRKQF